MEKRRSELMPLVLRPAEISDAELLYEWRNDAETRRMSYSSNPVSWNEHTDWLRRVLADPSEVLQIAHLDGWPVGVLRFTLRSDGVHVSITVAPSARGRGFGRKLLGLGIDQFNSAYPARTYRARIKPENAASLSIFEACGFEIDFKSEEVIELSRSSGAGPIARDGHM
jgi:RimJ/RimL family protein N-acetyltransferase